MKRERGDVFVHALGSSLNPFLSDTPPQPAKRARKTAPTRARGATVPDEVPSQTKSKGKGKKKDPDAQPPEKRGAMFKKSCPKNILERVDRVMSQRFFMVDRRREGDELREEFSVLGSTGNVYTVSIDKRPSCSCPDSQKGNHCKHILFIYLKVLQVSQHSTHWYQKALLTSELESIFTNAPLAPNSVAHPRIREAYARTTGKLPAASTSDVADSSKRRIPGPEDDCPICYELMHGVSTDSLVFCDECGNALHKECFQQWAARASHNLTCVWCRAKWVTPGPAGAGDARLGADGYINLAGVAGLGPERDTSTYYHGPRRGQRYYGYQEYDEY